MFKQNKSILYVLLTIFCFYSLHKIIFCLLNLQLNKSIFNYSLEKLYAIYTFLSIVILLVLNKIKHKNIDLVGNVFMLITCIKTLICYALIRPVIINRENNHAIEKWNFLILFMIFLIIETVATIKILNAEDEN